MIKKSKRRTFKPTKILLYKRVPKLIQEMRVPLPLDEFAPVHGRRNGPANADECSGAQDVLYRLLSTESGHHIARNLGRSPQKVYDALDLALSLLPHELEAGSFRKSPARKS